MMSYILVCRMTYCLNKKSYEFISKLLHLHLSVDSFTKTILMLTSSTSPYFLLILCFSFSLLIKQLSMQSVSKRLYKDMKKCVDMESGQSIKILLNIYIYHRQPLLEFQSIKTIWQVLLV